jgi:transcriptional regulator with XRE-family HTH domain
MKPGPAPGGESLAFQVPTGPPSKVGRERTVEGMDNRNEIRDFLTSRRARITPERAGLPAYGGNRRVAGLRREEVALLAGVSIDYYTRLERGKATGVSESVLEGLARALQLDEAERAHLFDLVRAASTATRPRRRPAGRQVRPSIQRILDSMTTTPAYVRNERLDILAANRLGRALYAPLFDSPAQPANPARFLFLDPAAERFYTDWERQAQDTVAMLRSLAGHNPYDRALSNLIGELSTRSEAFRTWWAAHNVRFHRSGVKRFRHPVVGDLTLAYEALDLAADPGLRISAYTAEPGTPSEDALNLLASWAATLDQAETETADAADGA